MRLLQATRDEDGLWRTSGVFQRVALAIVAATAVFFLVNLGLGIAQADFDAEIIQAGSTTTLSLQRGETREVYLTAEESAPLNFDFYPSDLACEMQDSEGRVVIGHLISDDRRLIDAWSSHWGVEAFEAPRTGDYELLCRDNADRRYPLVVARPSRTETYGATPGFALFLLVLAALLFAVTSGVALVQNLWRSVRSRR